MFNSNNRLTYEPGCEKAPAILQVKRINNCSGITIYGIAIITKSFTQNSF